jgi:hypothetical protein
MDHEELLRDIAALGEEFDRLGARLGEAGRGLRDEGAAPSGRLLDDLAAARQAFQRLRARVVELARAAGGELPEEAAENLDSLRGLLALLEDVGARRRRRAAVEQARDAALGLLDRVATLVHRDRPDFAPLLSCQAEAAALRQAVAAAGTELHPEVERLVTGTHPLAMLIALVHRLADLSDDEWEQMQDGVAGAFGRPLAVAASRGRLVFAPESAPVPAPAAAPLAPAPPAPTPPAPAPAGTRPPPASAPGPATAGPGAPAEVSLPAPAGLAGMPPEEEDPVAQALEADVGRERPGPEAPAPAVAPAPPAPPPAAASAPAPAEPAEEAPSAALAAPTLSPAAEAARAQGLARLGATPVPVPELPARCLALLRELRAGAAELADFAEELRRLRYFHAVAIGVGGDTAAARAFAGSFPSKLGYPELVVLDSLDPGTIGRTIGHLDLLHTLFLVFARDELPGETQALYRLCRERLEHGMPGAGKQFVAIAPGGSALETLAQEQQFRRFFPLPAGLAEGQEALSWAAAVPAALIGVNLDGFLARAEDMAARCRDASAADNPGLALGALLAGGAAAGRDKITLVLSPRLEPLGPWLEQLLSNVRDGGGRGLVPVAGETLGGPAGYGTDRVFTALGLPGEEEPQGRLGALEVVGHPVWRTVLRDPLDLAGELVRWQVAAAVAGALLGLAPEAEPRREAAPARFGRKLGDGRAAASEGGLRLFTDPPTPVSSVAEGLAAHFAQARAGGCLTLLPYLPAEGDSLALLQALRAVLRDRLRLATRLGRTPGYLQATGQLRAGAGTLFVQITSEDREDLPVPGERQTFGGLKRARALADFQALREVGCPVVRVHLDGVPATGLRRLNEIVARALARYGERRGDPLAPPSPGGKREP